VRHERSRQAGAAGTDQPADRQSGASGPAHNCNLQLVRQYQGEGAEWQLTWSNDCAYYRTYNNAQQAHLGTVVMTSRTGEPQVTTT
jgi:hypothetical protein